MAPDDATPQDETGAMPPNVAPAGPAVDPHDDVGAPPNATAVGVWATPHDEGGAAPPNSVGAPEPDDPHEEPPVPPPNDAVGELVHPQLLPFTIQDGGAAGRTGGNIASTGGSDGTIVGGSGGTGRTGSTAIGGGAIGCVGLSTTTVPLPPPITVSGPESPAKPLPVQP